MTNLNPCEMLVEKVTIQYIVSVIQFFLAVDRMDHVDQLTLTKTYS